MHSHHTQNNLNYERGMQFNLYLSLSNPILKVPTHSRFDGAPLWLRRQNKTYTGGGGGCIGIPFTGEYSHSKVHTGLPRFAGDTC